MKKQLLISTFVFFAFVFAKAQTPIITTIAGNGVPGYGGDGGAAISAKFFYPRGVTKDANENLYIVDNGNQVVRKVNSAGVITTIAGKDSLGTAGYSGDGSAATSAKLNNPYGVAVDRVGNIYIADRNNNVIRKVDLFGIISTFAGRDSSGVGIAGYSGDGGPAVSAELDHPESVSVDGLGNVYISDNNNNVVRKVNSSGIISTFAGTYNGYSGDGGPATSAALRFPCGLAIDKSGNIYICDQDNHVIRKVNTAGIISTIAGNGTAGFSGDGGVATSAQLWYPLGVVVDTSGNIYINDSENSNVIRKVNSSGIISTFAGIPNSWGYSGDGGVAIAAQLSICYGITVDSAGNVYIADSYNQVIREVGTCIPIIPKICMVEVDSLSKNNIIYWDKTPYTADTFYVYRDTANYNYALIGKVAYSSLSMFTDTVRHLYAANGDPNASSWRYKIAYKDTCGGDGKMSPMSPWHQTLFMLNSTGSFLWTAYQIEGQSQPVSGLQNYLFERDDNATGNYNTIQTLSASSTLYTDVNYATYQSTADWRVETKWTTVCTPTLRTGNNGTQAAVVKSRSNVRNNRAIGINQIKRNSNGISIYPNPTNGILNIQTDKQIENGSIEIFNVLDERIYVEKVEKQNSQLDISSLSSGIYQIRLLSNNVLINQSKIVKQ